jgi:hypothetical protein
MDRKKTETGLDYDRLGPDRRLRVADFSDGRYQSINRLKLVWLKGTPCKYLQNASKNVEKY